MLCGYDHTCHIQPGDAMLMLNFAGFDRKLVRCAVHAGEPVPDLLAEAPAAPSRIRVPDFSAVSRLAKDYRSAQAGRDE
jgi:hypothetical protein